MFQMMQLLTQNMQAQANNQRYSATPGPGSVREPKVKDPETFSGQREQLNAFLTECTLVFELQPSRFPDDRTKVNYMISLLRGTALMAIRPHLTAAIRPRFLNDYDEFVLHMSTNFGDPDERGTARRKLKALRQTGSASAYFSELQQYVAILGWLDQEPIVDRAIEGLKPSLKDELAREKDRPATLAELIKYVVPLDNRLYEREQERKREQKDDKDNSGKQQNRQTTGNSGTGNTTNNPNRQTSTKVVETHVTAGNYRPTTANTTSFQRTSTFNNTRGPLSAEEKQRRINEGLCLWCGVKGHISRDCPDLKARDAARAAQLKAAVEQSGEGNVENPSS